MKYLHIPSLAWVSTYLQDLVVGTEIWDGQVDAYSCKAAGTSKKLRKRLMRQYSKDAEDRDALYSELNGTKAPIVITPLGPSDSADTHKMLVILISCLNATFGMDGHDFSALTSKNFETLEPHEKGIAEIDRRFRKIETLNNDSTFVRKMWSAIDDVICIRDCTVYRYLPDLSSDPLSSKHGIPALWSMNYFFFNKNINRIVFITCTAVSKSSYESAMTTRRTPSPMPDAWRDDESTAARDALSTNLFSSAPEDAKTSEVSRRSNEECDEKGQHRGDVEATSGAADEEECWDYEVATCDRDYDGEDWEDRKSVV